MEEQIKQHSDFNAELAELASAPGYARYFGALAANSLGKNPFMSAEDKHIVMQDMVNELNEAVDASHSMKA